jgi:hypothetical protein
VLACALVAGCGVPVDDEPRVLDRAAAPFRVFATLEPPQPEGEVQAELFLVLNGQIQSVQRQVPRPGSPQQVLRQLIDGPTKAESESGLSSALPVGLTLQELQVTDRTAVVTLDGLDEQVRTDQVVAFAQIVATLDALPQIDGVRFRRRDADLPVPTGDGQLTDDPVDRQDYAELLGLTSTTPVVPSPLAPPPEPAPAEPPPAPPSG